MVLFDLDPDIIRWGLHHLLPASSSACGYSAHDRTPTTPCTAFVRPLDHQPTGTGDMGISHSVEVKVEHVDAVDNDEVIAQALQEELSHDALAEASGATSASDDQQHSAVLTQQWPRPRDVHVESGVTPPPASQETGTREEPFSTCSSPGNDNNGQDNQPCLIELMDNFSVLDGEVGKRLNSMASIPHVPKINGEIPSVDEAISDHQRLLDRLVLYGLVDLKVKGDGNCQF